MNFFRRAFYAVIKRSGYTLLLLLIFAVIANLVLAGFAIQNATAQAEVFARQKLGGQITLQFDRAKAMEKAMAANPPSDSGGPRRIPLTVQPVTEEMAEMVASNRHIVSYNYLVNTTAMADDFSPVTSEEEETQAQQPPGFVIRDTGNAVLPDITLTGVKFSQLYESFANGTYTLTDGEPISSAGDAQDTVLIEKQLAALNNLSVGDSITISAPGAGDHTLQLTIAGIYYSGKAAAPQGSGFSMSFAEPYNRLFVNYRSALDVKEAAASTGQRGMGGFSTPGIDQVVYFVDDPVNVEKVLAESKELGIDWDTFILDANNAAFERMVGPIKNVASFSNLLVIIVAVAGVAILALILMLWVKERMYETGVLLAIGESKAKVVAQYAAEVLLVALIAFSLSVFTGSYTSQAVGDTLLAREIQAAETVGDSRRPVYTNMFRGRGGFGMTADMNQYNPISEIDISISRDLIARLFGIGLLIALGATIVPAALVMRYKPRAILTNAN